MALKDFAGRARRLATGARAYATQNRSTVDNALDAVGRAVDARTGRKHATQIQKVKDTIKKAY